MRAETLESRIARDCPPLLSYEVTKPEMQNEMHCLVDMEGKLAGWHTFTIPRGVLVGVSCLDLMNERFRGSERGGILGKFLQSK